MTNYDVIIIGNSILGLSTAFALSERDAALQIAVIGPAQRPGGASQAAGAMLNCFGEVTTVTCSNPYSRAKFALSRRAANLWPAWLAQINAQLPDMETVHIMPGTYVILNSGPSQIDAANFRAMVAALDAYNEPYTKVDPQTIPGLNVQASCAPWDALYLPQEGAIEARQLLAALTALLPKHNVTLIDELVTSIRVAGSAVCGVITNQATVYNADQVLIAAGAFSQPLIDQLPALSGALPPVLAGVGASMIIDQVRTNPVEAVIRTPNRAGACGLHVVPQADHRLYVGATNDITPTPRFAPNVREMNTILPDLLTQINPHLFRSSLQGYKVGNRPVPLDTFPLIGDTPINRLWLLTGTYREGFHQSPLLAQHMADKMLGGSGLLEHNCFAPMRKPIQIYTQAESIDEMTKQYTSHLLEMGTGALPGQPLAEAVRLYVERLYEKLDTAYGLAPDLLFMLTWDDQVEKPFALIRNYLKAVA